MYPTVHHVTFALHIRYPISGQMWVVFMYPVVLLHHIGLLQIWQSIGGRVQMSLAAPLQSKRYTQLFPPPLCPHW